jgi:hypothetical protein
MLSLAFRLVLGASMFLFTGRVTIEVCNHKSRKVHNDVGLSMLLVENDRG